MPNIIQIRQHKGVFVTKYDILINGVFAQKGSQSIFQFSPTISVTPAQGGDPVYTIHQFNSPLRPQYIFQFGANRYDLTTVSVEKRHYQIHMGREVFDIYGHRKKKVSVFLNNKQVAWFGHAAAKLFSGGGCVYTIHASADVSADWMSAIALFWDSYFNRGKKLAVTIEFISCEEARPFDEKWAPL